MVHESRMDSLRSALTVLREGSTAAQSGGRRADDRPGALVALVLHLWLRRLATAASGAAIPAVFSTSTRCAG